LSRNIPEREYFAHHESKLMRLLRELMAFPLFSLSSTMVFKKCNDLCALDEQQDPEALVPAACGIVKYRDYHAIPEKKRPQRSYERR
jgi:hypothetical protein